MSFSTGALVVSLLTLPVALLMQLLHLPKLYALIAGKFTQLFQLANF